MCEYFHFIDEEKNAGSRMLPSGRDKTQSQVHSTVEPIMYCMFSTSLHRAVVNIKEKWFDLGVLNVAFVIGEFAVSVGLGISLGCVIGACHND